MPGLWAAYMLGLGVSAAANGAARAQGTQREGGEFCGRITAVLGAFSRHETLGNPADAVRPSRWKQAIQLREDIADAPDISPEEKQCINEWPTRLQGITGTYVEFMTEGAMPAGATPTFLRLGRSGGVQVDVETGGAGAMTVYDIGRTAGGDLDLEWVERFWTRASGRVENAHYSLHKWEPGGPTGLGMCAGTTPEVMFFAEGYSLLGEPAHRSLAWTPLMCGKLVRIESTSAAEAQAPTPPEELNVTSQGANVPPALEDAGDQPDGGLSGPLVCGLGATAAAVFAVMRRRERVSPGDEESRGMELAAIEVEI